MTSHLTQDDIMSAWKPSGVIGLSVLVCGVLCVGQRASAGDAPKFDPALGAIAGSSKWEETTFVILAADGDRVVAIPKTEGQPYGSNPLFENRKPPGFGPRMFFVELKPGKYEVLAMAPGKRLARNTVEVTADKMTFFWAILEEDRSELKVDDTLRAKRTYFLTKAEAIEEARLKEQP
ncbi:MAG: hypothetical protein WBC44_09855 [Planctomycetaceae bacterium]